MCEADNLCAQPLSSLTAYGSREGLVKQARNVINAALCAEGHCSLFLKESEGETASPKAAELFPQCFHVRFLGPLEQTLVLNFPSHPISVY